VAAVGVVAALALAGCGVPVDRSPSALPRRGIPFGLLQPSSRATTTTSTPSPVTVPVRIYLVGANGRLVGVTRELQTDQESPADVLGALVRGPSNAEVAAGLESAVPPQTVVLGASVGAGGVATVNLAGTFEQLVGQPLIQAVAQIVFTAAGLPGVTAVSFQLGGTGVSVPVANGVLVATASPSQFASLAPLPL
jgi:spore germination protein GerM